jgi:antitoxin VapB
MNKHDPAPKRAKVFWSGRSQAVRLPKEFRFSSDEVIIRRQGDAIVLEPAPADNDWAWLDNVVGHFSDSAIRAIEEERVEPQHRPDLDQLFK